MNQAKRRNSANVTPSKDQQGIVLIACLIVVVAVTLLASSVTKTSQFEERMAQNAQNYNRTFQAAETAVAAGYSNDDLLEAAFDDADGLSDELDIDISTPGVSATTQLVHGIGDGAAAVAPPEGFSLTSDEGKGIDALKFEVQASGKVDDINASTNIRQGFVKYKYVEG